MKKYVILYGVTRSGSQEQFLIEVYAANQNDAFIIACGKIYSMYANTTSTIVALNVTPTVDSEPEPEPDPEPTEDNESE